MVTPPTPGSQDDRGSAVSRGPPDSMPNREVRTRTSSIGQDRLQPLATPSENKIYARIKAFFYRAGGRSKLDRAAEKSTQVAAGQPKLGFFKQLKTLGRSSPPITTVKTKEEESVDAIVTRAKNAGSDPTELYREAKLLKKSLRPAEAAKVDVVIEKLVPKVLVIGPKEKEELDNMLIGGVEVEEPRFEQLLIKVLMNVTNSKGQAQAEAVSYLNKLKRLPVYEEVIKNSKDQLIRNHAEILLHKFVEPEEPEELKKPEEPKEPKLTDKQI